MREQTGYGQGTFIRRRASAPTTRAAASKHYAGHSAGNLPITTGTHPGRQSAYDDEIDDAVYDQRPSTSTRRYLQPQEEVYTQGNRKIVVHHEPPPDKRHVHWMFFMGLALCIMVLGWIALGALLNWWQTKEDDWAYGNPRTYQIDQAVGINDSPQTPSHFIAQNLHGTIYVIDVEGGNPTKALIIPVIALSDGQQTDPVTISFHDVNGDGKPDLLVSVAGFTIVFINTGKTFQAVHQ